MLSFTYCCRLQIAFQLHLFPDLSPKCHDFHVLNFNLIQLVLLSTRESIDRFVTKGVGFPGLNHNATNG